MSLHPAALRYDTMAGESAIFISQGQQQFPYCNVSCLSNPPILLLDEATSSIDTRTEQLVQKVFDTIMKGRTSLAVAHRLSTIQGADCILASRMAHLERGIYDELFGPRFLTPTLRESI